MNACKLRWRVSLLGMMVVLMVMGSRQLAHAQSPVPGNDSNQSWTSTSESGNSSFSSDPTRTTQSHTESEGRTRDTQSVLRRGLDRRYENYLDIEKETVKVDTSTMRTVEHVYARDPDGRRTLVEVREEETRTLPGNELKVVRSTSNADVNGRMQVIRREIQETHQTSPDVRDTKSTVLSPSGNGEFTPSVQTEERQVRRGEHLTEFHKSTSLQDGNGNWRVAEVRQGTVQDNGKDRTKDENLLRPDTEGRLTVIERNVSHEAIAASGNKSQTVETFSKDVPGGFGDGTLRLNQRQTSVERSRPDGTRTREQQVEQRSAGEPAAGLRPTQKTIDIVRPGLSGKSQETTTIQSRDADGNMGTVWVDTTQTTTTPAIQVDTKTGTAASPPPSKTPQGPSK